MPVSPTPPLLFRQPEQILTLAGAPAPRRGKDLGELGIVPRGSVLTGYGKILQVGTTTDLDAEARRLKARVIDCRGRVVMPGFVDSHTHLIFAGSRVEDYEVRLRGKTYEEIAAAGGGIRLSARLLREASIGELEAKAKHSLDQFAAHGTTTVEVKSGYGLDFANEMKTLQVVRRLQQHSTIELVPTLLAAHVLPPPYAGRASAYIDLIVRKLIPGVASRKVAEYIDCFCDRGAFSVAQCRQVLEAGVRHGLVPRVHAEQLTRTGASRLAVKLGTASADHLDRVTGKDIRALAASNVVATLLPGSNFHLGLQRYAPARRLIEAGAIVALATDFNPGTSPTPNMQMILSIACAALHLTPAEAISAATFNAAHALRRAHRLGSIEPGKQADLVVMDLDDYREIPYYFGVNHCVMAVKGGRIIYSVE
jgi:imidazolonepropionase